ncbi:MAG: hypothetical protein CR989_02285 [Flavobacteriales bacterium]|nr:MAG: hypothetical protein CR989_02285 [Flavobacteriales bacterium]
MDIKHKIQEELDVMEQEMPQHEIILFNDDINTFDFVIEALIKVCEHTPLQAEQCTHLVHFKGKCSVKSGEYADLEPRCTKLLDLGLSAEIV